MADYQWPRDWVSRTILERANGAPLPRPPRDPFPPPENGGKLTPMTNYLRALIQKYPFIATLGSGAAAYYGPQFKPAAKAVAIALGLCS